MTREQFYIEHAKHLKDKPQEIALRDGYEMHYPNGDIYKYKEVLKPGRTPSRWSGSYFTDDFTYYCYWNGELITDESEDLLQTDRPGSGEKGSTP